MPTDRPDITSDDDLMARVRDGEPAQLGVLFERHHVRLYNYFLRLTGNRQVSEDLVQEAFLRMLHYRHTYRGGGGGRGTSTFRAWMFQIGRNAAMDQFRRGGREESEEPQVADRRESALPQPAEVAERAEEERLLRRALARLPADKREVLVLSRYELLKYQEIAELTGSTVGAIKVRVHRALKQLRTIYGELAGETT